MASGQHTLGVFGIRDFSKENHIFSKKLLRSVEQSEMFRNRGKKFREDCVNPPIFSFIKFENCHYCSNSPLVYIKN